MTGAVGLVFSLSAHLCDWPMAVGGSRAITDALASFTRAHGGQIETSRPVRTLADVPDAKVVLFDLAPKQLIHRCDGFAFARDDPIVITEIGIYV